MSILEFDGDLLRVVVATASPNNNFLSSGNFFVPFDFRPRPIDDDGQSSYPFGEKLVRFFGAVCKKNDQDQDSIPFLRVKSFVQHMYVVDAPDSYLLMNAPHVLGVSLPAPAGAGGERIRHGAFGIHMLEELQRAKRFWSETGDCPCDADARPPPIATAPPGPETTRTGPPVRPASSSSYGLNWPILASFGHLERRCQSKTG